MNIVNLILIEQNKLVISHMHVDTSCLINPVIFIHTNHPIIVYTTKTIVLEKNA